MPHTTRVALKYPKGRTHDESLTTPLPLAPGDEFELYGHRWHAVGWASTRSRYNHVPRTLVCEDAASSEPGSRAAA